MEKESFFPREVTSNVPHITLIGAEQLHLEQHQGIISYQTEEIVFRTVCGALRIRGEKLYFCRYSAAEAIISGQIISISFDAGGIK